MLWSKSFIPTLKEVPREAESAAHQLMLRAGLVRMLVAGVYSYLPLGLKILNNIEDIIRQEMNAIGAQELLLAVLQPQELWDRSGRNKLMEEIMIRFIDRRGRKMCLGPTHEEVITDLAASYISSYKQLPVVLYQIQTKFRDEIRPRFGLVRSCEFIMKDAYSFDSCEEGLDKNYKLMYQVYLRIFKRLRLDCVVTEADPGIMGGDASHEFMVLADSGEDTVYTCKGCSYADTKSITTCPRCCGAMEEKKAIEIGHIFKLGTKYSQGLGLSFLDEKGSRNNIIMGCYGIGVSRLISAIIELNHDSDGIIWPREVAPYDCLVVPLNVSDTRSFSLAEDIYRKLISKGLEVLLDDRDERAGVKFKDADLIGIPLQVIVGTQAAKDNEVELRARSHKEKNIVKIDKALDGIISILDKLGEKNRDNAKSGSYR